MSDPNVPALAWAAGQLLEATLTRDQAAGELDVPLDDDPLVRPEVADLESELAAAWPRSAHIAGRPWRRLVAQAGHALSRVFTPPGERIPDAPESLSAIVRRLTQQRTVVVIVEGLESAPSLWLDLLRYLAPEIARDLPALVVVTLDAPQPVPDLPNDRSTETLHLASTLHGEGRADLLWLGPVSVPEIATFVGAAHPELPRRPHDLADGIPAIVESLWDAWVAEGVVAQDATATWQVADAGRGWVFGDLRTLR